MKNLTILKTISTLTIASGIFLSTASAEHRHGVEYAIAQVERSTDRLLGDYKRELKLRDLWKPRGEYHQLWVSIHRMEKYADSLKKHRRSNLASLAKVVGVIDGYLHSGEDAIRHCRVSSRIHTGLKQVSAATHRLTAYCNDGGGRNYDRGRSYERRGGYDDRRRGYRDDRYADRRRERNTYSYRRTFRF